MLPFIKKDVMTITGFKTLETVVTEIDSQFKTQLLQFIDQLENREIFDHDLYDDLLSYSLNEREFNRMIETIKLFSFEEDEDKEEVNFPYEDWLERITTQIIIK